MGGVINLLSRRPTKEPEREFLLNRSTRDASSDVFTAIDVAERILPGAAGDAPRDPRWQAIISIADYPQSQPEPIWQFITRWAAHGDDDLRDAIATCLLEHLLGFHFEQYIAVVEAEVRQDRDFADTFTRCGKFGQSELARNAERFDRVQAEARSLAG
jgi:hypothetical protein